MVLQVDLNPRPDDYKSTALPTELLRHIVSINTSTLLYTKYTKNNKLKVKNIFKKYVF